MNKVFLLIPALKDDGPIRGAIAIANGLCKYFEVSLVVIKKKNLIKFSLNQRLKLFHWEKVISGLQSIEYTKKF